jgi:hypothetical protein
VYQVSFEESELGDSYSILKFNMTTLRGIYNKDVGERKGTIIFKQYH